jgi:hypothetical protein
MNKKGDTSMLEFLMRLLLALIIFVPVIFFVAKYFFVSNDSQDTLNAISDKIVELNKVPNQEMTNVPLRFGRYGSVITFSKSSTIIFLESSGDYGLVKKSSFARPVACSGDCFCVCSDKFVAKKDDGVIGCGGKLVCKSVDYYHFPSKFIVNVSNSQYSEVNRVLKFEGGFFLDYYHSDYVYSTLFVKQAVNLLCFSMNNDIRCVDG